MVYSKIAVCPTCGKKTLLRIQNGGYLNKYPIRVNCMNCKTLIKGVYGMNSMPLGLKLYNAGIQEPVVEVKKDKNNVNSQVFVKNADYIAEISGELPCRIIQNNSGQLPLTPFISSCERLSSIPGRIDRLKDFVPNMEIWNKQKSIAFQLLSDGSIEYISKALKNKFGDYYYECDHYLKSLHCLQEIVLEEARYLFVNTTIEKYISSTINSLSFIDKTKIIDFINEIGGAEELINLYRKSIEVFTDFMDVYEYLLPAETYMYYTVKDKELINVSTCTFDDIKSFYQDAYEALASLLFIPVCLDNIYVRGSYNLFNEKYNRIKYNGVKNFEGERDIEWYKLLDNGIKVNRINTKEKFEKLINLPANNKLRNGIGHNNFSYDGINQLVTTYGLKNQNKIEYQSSLMDVAIDCLNIAKSSVIFSEIILFLLRTIFNCEGIHTIVHPSFYENIDAYDKCPCGSGLSYKRCCMKTMDKMMKNIKQ